MNPSFPSKFILFLLIGFSSCVYTFSGGFPSKYRNIYVETLKNSSQRQNISVLIQNFFIQDLQKDGRLNIVSKEKSTLSIVPEITAFRKSATEFTETGEVKVYTVSIKAKILIPINGDSIYFLKDSIFSGRGIYRANEEDEKTGIERAIEDLTNNFLGKLFEVKI